jgi:hypothetical protein
VGLVSNREVSRILSEFKRFLSANVPLPSEEVVVRRYVGRVVDRNLSIVAGFPICIMMLLDDAMIPYESVFELVEPLSVVVVTPEQAARIAEAQGGRGAPSGPLYISTCYLSKECIYYAYDARNTDHEFIAKHIVLLRHVNVLITEYIMSGRCRGGSLADAYMNCIRRITGEVAGIARRWGGRLLLDKVLDDPFKLFCNPDIVLQHGT